MKILHMFFNGEPRAALTELRRNYGSANVAGPESLQSLCDHLRRMSDSAGDQIDADRLSLAADAIAILPVRIAELGAERHALQELVNAEELRANENKAEIERLREALDAIQQYGSDTLSGPSRDPLGSAFVPDDRKWQRDSVLEMTRRARAALQEGRR